MPGLRNVLLALVCVAGGTSWLAAAQSYPSRPIRLVIPFPPGGNVDTFGRVVMRQLESQLGQPIVIDNRGGANGILGSELVAKAAPDGYTIMNTSFSFAINPSIYKKLPFDMEKDFYPVTNIALGLGYVLCVHASVTAKSVRELVAFAKSTPLRYSSPGVGNGQHLAMEYFGLKAGTTMLHVPYKGGGPSMNAVLGGEVHATFTAAAVGAPHFKAGRLRALGFSGAARLASLPDVPTIAEAGIPGFLYDAGWHGVFAPPRTPSAIVNKLQTEIHRALQEPKVREFLQSGGYEPRGDTPEAFRKMFLSDIKKYGEIARAAKLEQQ